jgi:hypothetical protein
LQNNPNKSADVIDSLLHFLIQSIDVSRFLGPYVLANMSNKATHNEVLRRWDFYAEIKI